MRRQLAVIALALATLAVTACTDITAPTEREACPVMNGSGKCEGEG